MNYTRKGQELILSIDKEYANRPISDLFQDLHFSRKTIHLLKQNKAYTLNHHYEKEDTLMHQGDVLALNAYAHDDGMYLPVQGPLDVVYEDEILLIVNKPAYLPMFPDDQSKTRSLSHLVSGYYHDKGEDLPVRFIHRLDNDTSGLVIFCKCALLQPMLDYMLSIKAIHRYYLAYVSGTFPDTKEHKIDKPLAKDRHDSKRMRVASKGMEAITYYQLIENQGDHALISCRLETGRKHQIRVHLSAIGHPLLGDPLYNKHPGKLQRQALHAYLLEFEHPLTHELLHLTCDAPKELKKGLSKSA